MSIKYSEIRDQIKTGDLLAWKTKKIGSLSDMVLYLYQKIFKVEYSHVGVVVVLGGRVFVIEATPPVVRLYPLSRKDDFYWVTCGLAEKQNYIEYLFNTVGNSYSLLDLIKSCLHIKLNNSDFYCSELVGDFYKYAGLLDSDEYGQMPHILVNAVVSATNKQPVFVSIDKGNI